MSESSLSRAQDVNAIELWLGISAHARSEVSPLIRGDARRTQRTLAQQGRIVRQCGIRSHTVGAGARHNPEK